MAELIPFKGYMYNREKIEKIENMISLPYDKISSKMQKDYYNKSENNIIRVILGENLPADNEENNKYTRASSYMKKWITDKVLVEDNNSCIYIYKQEFDVPGQNDIDSQKRKFSRTGLIVLVKLEEFDKGVVLPHEKTLSGPKKDRLKLIQHCNMHFGQIFGLYKDSSCEVKSLIEQEQQKESYFDVVTEEENIRHILWKIEDKDIIAQITALYKDKQLYIADGHHRYETAICYRNEMRKKYPELAETGLFNYIMMTLVDYKGLTVLPTHRVLDNYKIDNIDEYIDKFKQVFDVKEFDKNDLSSLTDEINKQDGFLKIGVGIKGLDKFLLLVLSNKNLLKNKFPEMPDCLRNLDVTVLHSLIINEILGISDKKVEDESYITYVRSAKSAIDMIDNNSDLVFLLKATEAGQVLNVADNALTMPQKSTDFYPKIYTGVVISNELNQNI